MIPTSITTQQNCKRKSHRINIPIHVIIEGKTYRVDDWSIHGFRVENLDIRLDIDETIDAALVLPTGSSSIILNVKARLRNVRKNGHGFDIVEITDKNARVLRHYAALAIDGNYNHVDDLSSDLFMVDVASPIKEPISLTENESDEVYRSFYKQAWFYVLVGLLFGAIAVVTILYNYLVVTHANGLISGNSHKYNAPKNGFLAAIYVEDDQKISKGKILFEMDSTHEKERLADREARQKILKKQLDEAEKMLDQVNRTIAKREKEIKTVVKTEAGALRQTYRLAKENYRRASKLFKSHLITATQFNNIESQYLKIKSRHEEMVERQKRAMEKSILEDPIYTKARDQQIALKRLIDKITLDITANENEIATLRKEIRSNIVTALEDGTVHNIFHRAHDYVKFPAQLMTLETDQNPDILTKLFLSQTDDIHIGEPCLVYSKRLNKFFNAHVTGIGYSVTEGKTTNTLEISQNEIPVRIVFDDTPEQLHLNEYLKVYFLNASDLAKRIFENIPLHLVLK